MKSTKNGFIRLLPSKRIVGDNFTDVGYKSWHISGISDSSLYLGNVTFPGRMLKVDTNLRKSKAFQISGFENFQIYRGSFVQVDSPSFYLMDGISPVILRGNVLDFRLTKKMEPSYFTGCIPLSDNSFLLRSVYSSRGNVLIKQFPDLQKVKMSKLLEPQVDGMFCTDGEMVKVPKSSKFIYVYYYRNQFLCADTNLNLLYKGKAIDTNSLAKIRITTIASTGETTLSGPPRLVNKTACVNAKYLFVQSALRANNETEYMIKNVSMIDVYSVSDGKYQFSFYLPDFKGFKVRDFKVYGQSLYALYDHYLYKYKLNF